MPNLCPEDRLSVLIEAMQTNDKNQDQLLDSLLQDFSEDPRLHFLQASIMVGTGKLIEAYAGFTRTLELEPDFAIARFQLGFFQLTSGEATNALETWGRLDRLPDGNYLRLFVDGLRCLIRDDFKGAVAKLTQGISINQDNIPLNKDMGLIIDQCRGLEVTSTDDNKTEAVSETALILKQFGDRTKLH